MEHILGIICYGMVLIFGVTMSVSFAGVKLCKGSIFMISLFCVIVICIQVISWEISGLEMTTKLYPFIAHFPLVIFLIFFMKKQWTMAVVSVLCSYLCCQIPKWFAYLAMAIFHNDFAFELFYILAIFLTYYVLHHFASTAVQRFMVQSRRSCMILGAVPLFYYIFDYATTVYTDLLVSGLRAAVQFMPSVVSVFYFVFVLIYYREVVKEEDSNRERRMLEIQLSQAKSDFDTICQLSENAKVYRHDMRHHVGMIKSFADEGRLDKVKDYLGQIQSDLDSITPVRFCENESINLILSAYNNKCSKQNIDLQIFTNMPEKVAISDTELCAVLANGLENAIKEVKSIEEPSLRYINIQIGINEGRESRISQDRILIQLKNPCIKDVTIINDLPQTTVPEHGYGTKSIAHIVTSHGGQYSFKTTDGVFCLKMMIPL